MTRRAGLWRALRSPRLALWLIGAMALFVVLSFLVPQRSILTVEQYRIWAANNPALSAASEALGADSIFTSWLFVATLALLAANLAACTYSRMVRARSYPPKAPSSTPEDATALSAAESGPLDTLRSGVFGRGWRFHQQDETTFLLWRGRVGRAGSITLHLGLMLLIVGGIVTSMTRFTGAMVITEGQGVSDAPGSYVEIRESPRLGSAFTGAVLAMESIDFTYEMDVVSDAVAKMRFTGRDGVERIQDVRVNYPLHLQGKAYLLQKAGLAVAVTVVDSTGQERLASFVNLGETGGDGSSDEVILGDATARLTLIADRRFAGRQDPRKYELNDPVLYVDLRARDTSGGVTLTPGSSAKIGEWTVEFAEARLWNRFMVRADGGRWISFASFALVIIGMALRWFDPDAMIVMRRVESQWLIWGRSRHGDFVVTRQIERVRRLLNSQPESVEED